jgi:hypothetical protein
LEKENFDSLKRKILAKAKGTILAIRKNFQCKIDGFLIWLPTHHTIAERRYSQHHQFVFKICE